MPDITCCKGETEQGFICPKRTKCYRFLAKPSMLQSYFTEMPWFNKKCDYFWKVEEKTHVKDERNIQCND